MIQLTCGCAWIGNDQVLFCPDRDGHSRTRCVAPKEETQMVFAMPSKTFYCPTCRIYFQEMDVTFDRINPRVPIHRISKEDEPDELHTVTEVKQSDR